MDCAIVIPARGGSRGVPRKNLAKIAGETLLARAIRISQAAHIGPVYVSTEDAEIAQEATDSGAQVIWRPVELAQDDSRSSEALLHALGQIDVDILAFVQCTAPFMTPEELRGAVERLIKTNADVCVVAAPTDALVVRETEDGRVAGVGWDLCSVHTLRQHRQQFYEITGSCWAMWADRFKQRRRSYSENCVIYKAHRRFEIDDKTDLEWARAIDLTKAGFPV